ncbi:PREDICTED: U-box domain-containing protein 28-like [Nelumbo nucifera]|uniref:U-box domain-containing protein n=1 Tax=Nelumbo nucifera TaxID=4432 RepID=A0A1U7Z3H4_NELNU|nr:PREDICTED: U-box domain-containing protein 28-like [Nelumbo nucifera]
MVKNDLFITVPSFFKCPISLDVMKSPVSLSTGVTYDRSSIQKWLDSGNNTCPATMQVLQSKDFVPNHTLHRLIQIWSDNLPNTTSSSSDASPATSPLLTQEQARILIKNIDDNTENRLDCFSKLVDFAKQSNENRAFLAKMDGFVRIIVGVLGSNADGGEEVVGIELFEHVVRILDLILMDYADKEQLMRLTLKGNKYFLSSILLVLKKGSLDSRIGSARVLEAIAVTGESKLLIAEKEGLLPEIIRLMTSEVDSIAIEAGLSCLITVSMPRRVRLQLVRLGIVQVLSKLLAHSDTGVSLAEKVLKLLEMVSTCPEGRTALCEDPTCIATIVQRMLKVSNTATEHAVMILWGVCHLFRDQKAQEAVTKSNGLTKILLLMQSNCSPSVRQMAGDLLKIFRVNSKSCLSSYDTKTKHIMPF